MKNIKLILASITLLSLTGIVLYFIAIILKENLLLGLFSGIAFVSYFASKIIEVIEEIKEKEARRKRLEEIKKDYINKF